MNLVLITWVIRLHPLDCIGKELLHKARCGVGSDHQIAEVDYYPFRTYAPVICHEAVRILLSHAAANDLIVEGGDVSNAHLYRNMDCEVYIENPTLCTGVEEMPAQVCLFKKAMYGIRQTGKILDDYSL